jgi:hypothetical protein
MSPRSSEPRRSESVESYVRQTRAGAALALLALAAAIASEQFAAHLNADAYAEVVDRDRGTLDLAVRIVSVAWWEARLGTTAHLGNDVPEAASRNAAEHGSLDRRNANATPSIQEEGL